MPASPRSRTHTRARLVPVAISARQSSSGHVHGSRISWSIACDTGPGRRPRAGVLAAHPHADHRPADLAVQEENHLRLTRATAEFREVTRQPGIAEAFDAAFPDDAPASRDAARRAA
ncbi:hypothetical protein ACFZCF_31915 [Streptomyces sp. NPDC007945]|uniref:hypothetical protein n=1 Tax=Streptomyces sp. NPDC007945 TaxID=3364797 RepID=UPI0036E4D106